MSDFIKGLWPRGLSAWVTLFLATLSVLKLIEYGFQFGYGPLLALLLGYYESFLSAIIAWWSEPIIKAVLSALNAYFGWGTHLYPHWKHVFVLMGLYLFRDAALGARFGIRHVGPPILLAFVTAAITSVIVGVVALGGGLGANVLVGVVPVASIVLLKAISTIPRSMHRQAAVDEQIHNLLTGVLVAVAGLVLAVTLGAPSPGLVALAAFIGTLALYMVVTGVLDAMRNRASYDSFSQALAATGTWEVGIGMIRVAFWTALFIAANAGLRFYGL